MKSQNVESSGMNEEADLENYNTDEPDTMLSAFVVRQEE